MTTARDILRAAEGSEKFGKLAYISSVHEHLSSGMSIEDFKRLIVELSLQGELKLSRADLPQAMNAGLVAASETRHLVAIFHFIDLR